MTMSVHHCLKCAIAKINGAALWVSGAAMVLMAVHVSLDAFSKYLLSLPIPATLEVVAFYYMPAVAMLPIAYVEQKRMHIAIEILFDKMSLSWRRVCLVVNGVLTLGIMGTLSWLATREAIRKIEIGEYMFGEYPIIIWPGRVLFAFGLVLFCCVALANTVDVIVEVITHKRVDDIARESNV
ncbi:MAG: TRAP transporter small permease [Pseudomonadota bacterium]